MAQEIGPGRMRAGGALFAACGAALLAIGAYLLAAPLDWHIPADGAGISTLWLLLAGAVTLAMGLQMLVTARRPRLLLRLLAVLLAIFVVAGVVVTLQSGGRLPRLYR